MNKGAEGDTELWVPQLWWPRVLLQGQAGEAGWICQGPETSTRTKSKEGEPERRKKEGKMSWYKGKRVKNLQSSRLWREEGKKMKNKKKSGNIELKKKNHMEETINRHDLILWLFVLRLFTFLTARTDLLTIDPLHRSSPLFTSPVPSYSGSLVPLLVPWSSKESPR